MESQKTRQKNAVVYGESCIWQVDSNTHEIICADPVAEQCDELRRKKISALIPPRKGAGYWPGEYVQTVTVQWLISE